MWTFANLARPSQFGRPAYYSPYSGHLNRADTALTPSKKDAMVEAGVYKGSAVLTAGVVGAISAYKGLPEIKGTLGLLSFDVIVGLILSGAEVAMIYKGMSGKKVAAVGGVSTGLLCHFAAVQGTIWGAGKAKAETVPTKTSGVDYDAHDRGARALPDARRNVAPASAARAPAPAARGFDPYYGMM